MAGKTAGELIREAENEYSKLSGMVKSQAAGVFLPILGSLKALSAEVEQLKGGNHA